MCFSKAPKLNLFKSMRKFKSVINTNILLKVLYRLDFINVIWVFYYFYRLIMPNFVIWFGNQLIKDNKLLFYYFINIIISY